MQNFLIGLVGLGEDLLDLFLHFRGGITSHGDELDQAARPLQVALDPGDIRKIVLAVIGGNEQFTRLLDQLAELNSGLESLTASEQFARLLDQGARLGDPVSGGGYTGHGNSSKIWDS